MGSWWCPTCKCYHREGVGCTDPIQREKDAKVPTSKSLQEIKVHSGWEWNNDPYRFWKRGL
jgi:hypothetical protein